MLIITALKEKFKELKELIDIKLPDFKFTNKISIHNINNNYNAIKRLVDDMKESDVNFLLRRCQFVRFVLSDISEAFQFFDSQNSRGKDLVPHDLLKAYHLREFSEDDKKYVDGAIASWEELDNDKSSLNLSNLFSNYLYRIRGWLKGNSSRYFEKKDIELFKGITLHSNDNRYPFAKSLIANNIFIERYNNHSDRIFDENTTHYPFQLDQNIINGKRFFEMIKYYAGLKCKYYNTIKSLKLSNNAYAVVEIIDQYKGKNRTGDRYTREMFDSALLYYVDKFGYAEISKIIELFFIWAYKPRLQQQVKLATIDNYVLDSNMFRVIRDSISPFQVLEYNVDNISEVKATKVDDLKIKFKELGYYHGI